MEDWYESKGILYIISDRQYDKICVRVFDEDGQCSSSDAYFPRKERYGWPEKIRKTVEEKYVQIGDRLVYRTDVIPSYKICKNCIYFVPSVSSSTDGKCFRYPETRMKHASEFCGELFLKDIREE